jgi:hypothetical protein
MSHAERQIRYDSLPLRQRARRWSATGTAVLTFALTPLAGCGEGGISFGSGGSSGGGDRAACKTLTGDEKQKCLRDADKKPDNGGGAVGGGGNKDNKNSGEIPESALAIYKKHPHSAILASMGKQESDHGRDGQPGTESGYNCAGAAGPMQFGIGISRRDTSCGNAGNAWGTYGVDGNGDGNVNVYDMADAVAAALKYLQALGIDRDARNAVSRYSGNTEGYADEVMSRAERYKKDFGLKM